MVQNMRNGDRKNYVILKTPTVTIGTDGHRSTTYTQIATLWVNIIPLRGKQYFLASQVNNEVTHEIYGAWRKGMKPKMAFEYQGRTLEILQVRNVEEKNIEFYVLAKEIT
jgi:SPP1 family predicted phage head-tail adaptor